MNHGCMAGPSHESINLGFLGELRCKFLKHSLWPTRGCGVRRRASCADRFWITFFDWFALTTYV